MEKNKIPFITKEMIVGDVVGLFPEAADIITSYGLHCVGCHVNAFETLEQGLLGHGYPEEVLQNMIDELNEYASEQSGGGVSPSKETGDPEIHVTPKAVKRIQEIAKKDQKVGMPLRIEVRQVPGAYKYSMNFIDEKEVEESDKVFFFARKKTRVVVSKRDYKKINGLEIDYIEEKDRAGFKMNNPNTAP